MQVCVQGHEDKEVLLVSHIHTCTHQKRCRYNCCIIHVSISFLYIQSDTHSCAAMICRAGSARGQERRGEVGDQGGARRNNQQGNHFQLCSCTAWLARGQVPPERGLAHPFSSPPSPPFFLSRTHIRSHSLQLCDATGEKEEEPRQLFFNYYFHTTASRAARNF